MDKINIAAALDYRPEPTASTAAAACCCAACGNCTKAPTFDSRTTCCCLACGHCFKRPTVVQVFTLPSAVSGFGTLDPRYQYGAAGYVAPSSGNGWRY